MSRITAAFAKCKLVDNILKLRRRKVESSIEVARINLKDERVTTELGIEEIIKKFADADCEYSSNLDNLLKKYEKLDRIDRTLDTIDKLEAYMNEEVEVELKSEE